VAVIDEESEDDNTICAGGFGCGGVISTYAVHEAEFELVRSAESSAYTYHVVPFKPELYE
jgi:hypothetical protein